MKDEKEHWTQGDMLDTFADTPHERHSWMVGFANGLSEGSRFDCDPKYRDEEQYYALGWSIGEIIDRIKNNCAEDTKQALAQFAGRTVKYLIISALGAGVMSIF